MNKESKLIYSAIRTPDGTLLESRHRHDYRTHTDANGEWYMIDGGTAYFRGRLNKEEPEYIQIYSDDEHSLIRKIFTWGTYGKDGDQPLRYITIAEMTDGHVKAIVETQTHLSEHIMQLFINELEYRNGN